MQVTITGLRQRLIYEPDTGRLRWVGLRNRAKGSVAGTIHQDGGVRVMIRRRNYHAHVLAWALHYGEWPETQVYHRGSDRTDNRICNLTLAPPSVLPSWGESGIRGVTFDGARFRARLKVRGKTYHLGLFDTAEEAHAAYMKARHCAIEELPL